MDNWSLDGGALLRLIQQSLLAIKRAGNTPVGKADHTADGRLAVEVFPTGTIDGMLCEYVRVDVNGQEAEGGRKNTCRTLQVRLLDSSLQSALFQFK